MQTATPQGASLRPGDEARTSRQQRGFTLLEIMAVVVIMCMLTALVVLQVADRLDSARVSTTKTKMVQLENAREMYKIDNARYPTTEQGLEALLTKPTSGPEPRRYPPNGYVQRRDALNDAWDVPFKYANPGQNNPGRFDLWSLGADEAPGGEATDADIGNWDDPVSASS